MASANADAELALTMTGIRDRYHTATCDDVERKERAPDCYELARKRLELDPEDVLAVEDSKSGVIAARAAGFFVITVSQNCDADQLSRANVIVENIADIRSWIRQCQNKASYA